MRPDGDFDYARARLLARHGARPQASDFATLSASRDLTHLLAAIQRSPLRWWAQALAPEMDPHTIERLLRAAWGGYVAEVSSWMPHPWQAALEWCRWVPELQLLARLAEEAAAPEWMFADPVYGPLASGSRADRAAAMVGGPLAPFRRSVLQEEPTDGAWLRHWRSLLPRPQLHASADLDALQRLAANFLATAGNSTAREMALDQFARGCARLLRRAADGAAGALAHLGSVAVDGMRLRGLLAARAVIAAAGELER